MPDSLKETKKRIQKKFLGKEGIHAVGLKRSENAIKVYTSAAKLNCLEQIKTVSLPYKVILVTEDEVPYLSSSELSLS